MARTISSVVLASMCLALAPLAGCTERCECAPPLWVDVRVVDGIDGGSILSARVNGLPCGGRCSLHSKPDGGPPSAGPVELTVTADRYQPVSITIDVPAAPPADLGCCGTGPPWVGEHWTIRLQPL
jgi:hypothetical protein